ncbi:MAG: hypothetical protein JRE19_05375 [Deltaproteobacteria bacterium]|jgi:hypothetical protein|nr:hypothetical protein [Deltaproteobacteria bacterium]MBW2685333.1 hypothetical protein [Deltaproteobacteria bacterium]
MRRALTAVVLCVSILAVSGCQKNIPNTTVADTPHNRAVITFMENYRDAVESRDIGALLAMAHPQYLDDNGTPSGDDDLDYRELQKKLGRWRERVTDVRYEIKYRSVTREMDRVLIAYRYSASFRIAYDEEDQRWSRRIGENRLVLLYDDIQARYYVLSGM